MYGVPAHLPLAMFAATTLTQIALGVHHVQFHFAPQGSISVEGYWEVHDAAGQVVDKAMSHAHRDVYRLHVLLGQQVVDYQVHAPHAFSLTFASGAILTIYDDSEEYETVTIQPGDIVI